MGTEQPSLSWVTQQLISRTPSCRTESPAVSTISRVPRPRTCMPSRVNRSLRMRSSSGPRDGGSDGWSTDDDFTSVMRGEYAPTIGGAPFRALKRRSFGDGDCMHLISLAGKENKKLFAAIAHSDFTCVSLVGDKDKHADGASAMQVQQLMEAYKEAGY